MNHRTQIGNYKTHIGYERAKRVVPKALRLQTNDRVPDQQNSQPKIDVTEPIEEKWYNAEHPSNPMIPVNAYRATGFIFSSISHKSDMGSPPMINIDIIQV